jgi:hypothetical protein
MCHPLPHYKPPIEALGRNRGSGISNDFVPKYCPSYIISRQHVCPNIEEYEFHGPWLAYEMVLSSR